MDEFITPDTGALDLTPEIEAYLRESTEEITPAEGTLALTGESPSVADRSIRPGAGALVLSGVGTLIYNSGRPVPLVGSLALSGKTPLVFVSEALEILFDIWSAGFFPLIVQFDIIGLDTVTQPLLVEFDIIESNPDALDVTFDILTGTLVESRLVNDVQGPVAEADLS